MYGSSMDVFFFDLILYFVDYVTRDIFVASPSERLLVLDFLNDFQ